MRRDPSEPAPPEHRPFQFTLANLLTWVTLVAVALGLWRWLGPLAGMFFVDFVVVMLWTARLAERKTLFGLPLPRGTVFDFLVILLMLLLATTLFLPPIVAK